MIYIKAWFGDWTGVTEEKARAFIEHILTPCPERLKEKMFEKHCKGISYRELMGKDGE